MILVCSNRNLNQTKLYFFSLILKSFQIASNYSMHTPIRSPCSSDNDTH